MEKNLENAKSTQKKAYTNTTQLIKPATIKRFIHNLGYRIGEKAVKKLALLYTEKVKADMMFLLKDAFTYTEHSKRKTLKVRDIQRVFLKSDAELVTKTE